MFIVQDYFDKQLLAKLGYRFNPEELEEWEIEAYNLIASTVAKEEEREFNRNKKKK